jgi:hypothetical protein
MHVLERQDMTQRRVCLRLRVWWPWLEESARQGSACADLGGVGEIENKRWRGSVVRRRAASSQTPALRRRVTLRTARLRNGFISYGLK